MKKMPDWVQHALDNSPEPEGEPHIERLRRLNGLRKTLFGDPDATAENPQHQTTIGDKITQTVNEITPLIEAISDAAYRPQLSQESPLLQEWARFGVKLIGAALTAEQELRLLRHLHGINLALDLEREGMESLPFSEAARAIESAQERRRENCTR